MDQIREERLKARAQEDDEDVSLEENSWGGSDEEVVPSHERSLELRSNILISQMLKRVSSSNGQPRTYSPRPTPRNWRSVFLQTMGLTSGLPFYAAVGRAPGD